MSDGDARGAMLAAIRAALGDVPSTEPTAFIAEFDAAYTRTGALDPAARVALFAARCGEYRATVTRCGGEGEAIRAAIEQTCARHGVRTLAVAPGVAADRLPRDVDARRDEPPLDTAALDACEGALTGCAAAIAVTGTIVLDGSPLSGRRSLTLIPDLHVCVVHADQVLETVPEAIGRVERAVRDHGAPITLVSGPSATSDIELQRVEGVHGPRRLEVILAGG